MAERYYVNSPLQVGSVEIDGPEAHHLANVCRLRQESLVYLFNGDGNQYPAEVVEVSRRHVSLVIHSVEHPIRELDGHLEIASPLPKGDRAQFMIEKLTELGVSRFVPLRTSRSVVDPRETKLEKLQRTVIEASKQCGRNKLMRIDSLTDWDSYIRTADQPALRLLGHPLKHGIEQLPFESSLAGLLAKGKQDGVADLAIAVGPEGGFTEDEVNQAIKVGWKPVDLGPRILRIETAALALAAQVVMGMDFQGS